MFLIVSCMAILGQALTPSSYFSTIEVQRLRQVFENTINAKSRDLTSIHFAVMGTKLLDELEKSKTNSLAKSSQELCSFFQKKMGLSHRITMAIDLKRLKTLED